MNRTFCSRLADVLGTVTILASVGGLAAVLVVRLAVPVCVAVRVCVAVPARRRRHASRAGVSGYRG
jgi:phosphohistidine swiveling domain-containing protein